MLPPLPRIGAPFKIIKSKQILQILGLDKKYSGRVVERKKKKEKYEREETCEPSGVKHVQKISV